MAIVISGVNNNDKITATDGLIDLLSAVSFASTVTAPAFTASGNITAASINVGNNIQLGNAGVATATTFVGNLTGNVNNTGNLLLQISGSEKFRVGGSGQLGIGGANYGTSGQVLTSGGSGSAATWSTISGTTINSNTNNYLITGTGTANTLQGEANLTFNGTNFTTKASDSTTSANAGGSGVLIQNTNNTNNNQNFLGFYDSTGTSSAAIIAVHENHSSTTGNLQFGTRNAGTYAERLRIKSDGKINITPGGTLSGNHPPGDLNIVGTNFITMTPNDNANPSDNEVLGHIAFLPYGAGSIGAASAKIEAVAESGQSGSSNATSMRFYTKPSSSGPGNSPSERMRISQSGKVGINSTTPQQALDVKGSINGGSVNQPFLRFHDSHGRQRNTKHYFKCIKGGTTIFDILTVDLNQNFHQALIILYYGARIQAVSDSVTYPVHKIIGVNRFNGGSIQFTKNTIVQNSNVTNHADIDAVATSSTNYRIRLTYSGSTGGSSFCCGSVEIIGVGSGDDGCFYSLAHSHGLLA